MNLLVKFAKIDESKKVQLDNEKLQRYVITQDS